MDKDSKVKNIHFLIYWNLKIALNSSVIYPTQRTLQNFDNFLNFNANSTISTEIRITESQKTTIDIKRVSNLVYGVIVEWQNR